MHILFREVARGAAAGIFIEYGAVVHMLHIRIAAEELSRGHSTLATCSDAKVFMEVKLIRDQVPKRYDRPLT